MAACSCFRMRQHAKAIMPEDKVVTAVTLLEHRSHIKSNDSVVQECSTSVIMVKNRRKFKTFNQAMTLEHSLNLGNFDSQQFRILDQKVQKNLENLKCESFEEHICHDLSFKDT